jgi:hypothetical protein
MVLEDGKNAWVIKCHGSALTWAECREKAARVCRGGYKIINVEGESHPFAIGFSSYSAQGTGTATNYNANTNYQAQGSSNFSAGSMVTRVMYVRCNRKYVGGYKDGKMHGQGTYTWPDGKKYVGEWQDGKKHGQGTITSPDRRKYVGEYRNGNRWNGTYFDKQGNVAGYYVNGVWQPIQ